MKFMRMPVIYCKEIAIELLRYECSKLILSSAIYLIFLFINYIIRKEFKAYAIVCKYNRIIYNYSLNGKNNILQRIIKQKTLENLTGVNSLLDNFLNRRRSKIYRLEFFKYGVDNCLRLRYPKENDDPKRQGDLLVLKPYIGKNEKGVVFIKYNDALEKFISLFDSSKVARDYYIVLEPSTWGYQDIVFMYFVGLGTDVIIESQYQRDYDYIASLRSNLKPIRIGAGDWVDPAIFYPISPVKLYDFVMIASWQRLKRHDLFFRALAKIKSEVSRVALIGYPAGGKTLKDIEREALRYNIKDKVTFFERISPYEVRKILSESKASIMLSKREGANRAIYESLFCNVPIILTDQNVGVNREIINNQTGILSRDEELHNNLLKMLIDYKKFNPREWALKNTGYINSTRKLNDFLKKIATENGEDWSQNIFTKKNLPNATYVFESERQEAEKEFQRLVRYLRI